MEYVVVVQVLQSQYDLLGDPLLILEGRVRLEQVGHLEVVIHDHVDLVLLGDSFRPVEVDDLIARHDIPMGQSLKTIDLTETAEIDALAVIVGLLIELDCHKLGLAVAVSSEELLKEGTVVPLPPLVEVDRSVTT